ncbi:4-vinyl reductase [Candidatus Parvarchaeota archaeon]|nr:4-vinyl reductase [Candidatus Parvarchaeota archaeon]
MSSDITPNNFLNEMLLTKNVRFENNRLLLMNRPGVLINMSILVSLIGKLIKYDENEAYNAGSISIGGIISDYKNRFNNDINKTLELISNVVATSGLGKFVFSFDKDKIITTINPSPMAEAYLEIFGKSEKPVCFFSAGSLSAMFTSLMDKKYSTKEIYCKAKGDAECKFISEV